MKDLNFEKIQNYDPLNSKADHLGMVQSGSQEMNGGMRLHLVGQKQSAKWMRVDMLQVRTDKQLRGSWKQLLFFNYPPPNPTTIRCFSWSSKNIIKVNSIIPICFLNGTNSGTVVGRIEFYRDDRFTLAGVPLISRDACSGLYYLWYLYEVMIFYFFFADWCLSLRCA